MKGDWIVIAVLVVLFGLLTEAAGAPILLGALNIIAGWLNALPGATEHWASTLGSIAWPAAALLMVWWLREPVALAASKLAARFEKDDVEIGFLKVTNASLITLDEGAAAGRPATPESEDAIIVERLLEFAAESDENAGKLRDWISTEIGPTWDAEEFLSDDRYRDHRTRALQAMTGGE